MVPNGVGTGRPPAKLPPPRAVWQSLQLPSDASSRPCFTRAGSNVCGAGGSIAAIAGRHATANAAAAATTAIPVTTPAMIRGNPFISVPVLIVRSIVSSTYPGAAWRRKPSDHWQLTAGPPSPVVLGGSPSVTGPAIGNGLKEPGENHESAAEAAAATPVGHHRGVAGAGDRRAAGKPASGRLGRTGDQDRTARQGRFLP